MEATQIIEMALFLLEWHFRTWDGAANSISTRRQASVSTMRASTRNGVHSSLSIYNINTAPDWLRWIPSKHCNVFFREAGWCVQNNFVNILSKFVLPMYHSIEKKQAKIVDKQTRKAEQWLYSWRNPLPALTCQLWQADYVIGLRWANEACSRYQFEMLLRSFGINCKYLSPDSAATSFSVQREMQFWSDQKPKHWP